MVNVSATDKSTGEKHSITIRSSGGLSDADVEEMVQEFQEQLSNTTGWLPCRSLLQS